MAQYSGSGLNTVDHDRLRHQVTTILAAWRIPDDDRALIADAIVETDLRGVLTGGSFSPLRNRMQTPDQPGNIGAERLAQRIPVPPRLMAQMRDLAAPAGVPFMLENDA